jgi:hypothetical protein
MQQWNRKSWVGLWLMLTSSSAAGLVGVDPEVRFGANSSGLILNLGGGSTRKHSAFGLTGNTIRSQTATVFESLQEELARRRIFPANLGLQITSSDFLGLNAPAEDAVTAVPHFKGIPLCQGSVRAVRLRSGDISVVASQIPGYAVRSPSSYEFPTSADALGPLEEHAASLDRALGDRILVLQKCWIADQSMLNPAAWVTFSMDKLPYRALITSHASPVQQVEPMYFSAVGKAVIFPNNPKDEERVAYSLGDLIGNGKLESSVFTTFVNEAKPAEQCDHAFVYDPGDERYAEVASFTNASRTLSWFTSFLGYEWTDDPLTIRIHEEIGQSPNEKNNALYKPAASTDDGRPNILIGDGDGIQLQNLTLDQDVVSHEFGHHIVYRTLKSTVRESLVLHEGLADFFTFARTDDACLGESICPEGSQFCWTSSCLRTGETTLKFGDSSLPTQAHLRSQFISGMLWDLKIKHSVPIADVARIVYKSLDLFASEMVYEQFIAALINADKELFEGANCNTILTAAKDRGLTTRIADLSCGATSLAAVDASAPLRLKESTDTDSKFILKVSTNADEALATTSLCVSRPQAPGAMLTPCGVVGHDGSTADSSALWWLGLGPFAAMAITRARRRKTSAP